MRKARDRHWRSLDLKEADRRGAAVLAAIKSAPAWVGLVSQLDLARATGLSRDQVRRSLRDLEERGLLRVNRAQAKVRAGKTTGIRVRS